MTIAEHPDTIEALAAVCEASRGGQHPAPVGDIHACSGLNGRQLREQLPRLRQLGLVARHPHARGLLPTSRGLQVARLL